MARFRLIGYVVLNTFVALVGPAVLSSSLPPFHPQTGLGIIQKAWITSIVFAGFLGVVLQRSPRVERRFHGRMESFRNIVDEIRCSRNLALFVRQNLSQGVL